MTANFQPLLSELDAWRALGRQATLWWRDDDAGCDTEALRNLLGIAGTHRVPLAIAAVPASADRTLVDAIASCAEAMVVQHGFAHRNHARAGERSAELGGDRPLDARLAELAAGRDVLSRMFASRFAPLLVPPWNRIADDLVAALPGAGMHGLSCFGPRESAVPAPGLTQVNTHVDLIAWRRGRRFIGAEAAVDRVASHLRARRTGDVDAEEPTGILTHHLAFEGAAFDFMAELCASTRAHPAVEWLDVQRVFAGSTPPVTSSRSA